MPIGSVSQPTGSQPKAKPTGPEGPWAAAEQRRGRGGVGAGTGTLPALARPARRDTSPGFASVASATVTPCEAFAE